MPHASEQGSNRRREPPRRTPRVGAIRGPEAVEEVAVPRRSDAGASGLDGAQRAVSVAADGDRVGRAEDLEPYVVAERVVARARETASAPPLERAAPPRPCRRRRAARTTASRGPRRRRRPPTISRPVTKRIASKSWMCRSRKMPPDAAMYASGGGAGSCVAARRSEHVAERAARDCVVRGAIAGVEAALKADLYEDPGSLDVVAIASSSAASSSATGFSQKTGGPRARRAEQRDVRRRRRRRSRVRRRRPWTSGRRRRRRRHELAPPRARPARRRRR